MASWSGTAVPGRHDPRRRGSLAPAAARTGGLGRRGAPRLRGAIAVELAPAGAFFHGAGSSNRRTGPSEVDRPKTIEDTGELMNRAGGDGVPLRVYRVDVEAVAEQVTGLPGRHQSL